MKFAFMSVMLLLLPSAGAQTATIRVDAASPVNVDGAGTTPEQAAAWVEYVDGPATSKYGA